MRIFDLLIIGIETIAPFAAMYTIIVTIALSLVSVASLQYFTIILTPDSIAVTFQCPMCVNTKEVPFHFVHCNFPPMLHHKKILHRPLNLLLCKTETYEHLRGLINHILLNNTPDNYIMIEMHPVMKQLWDDAVAHQRHLGWDSFIRGMWSHKWFTLQEKHFEYKSITRSTK